MMRNEMQTVRAVLAGDPSAFEQLVLDNQRHVYGLALKLSGNPSDAEDLAQEAFIKAYTNLAQFRGESKFSVWMYRLTYNLCLDFLRKKKAEDAVSLDEAGELLQLPQEGGGPEDALFRREGERMILAAIRELPEKYAEVLLLRGMRQMRYDEIALALGLEEGTVKSRLNRARRMLAEKLQKNGTILEFDRHKNKRGGDAE